MWASFCEKNNLWPYWDGRISFTKRWKSHPFYSSWASIYTCWYFFYCIYWEQWSVMVFYVHSPLFSACSICFSNFSVFFLFFLCSSDNLLLYVLLPPWLTVYFIWQLSFLFFSFISLLTLFFVLVSFSLLFGKSYPILSLYSSFLWWLFGGLCLMSMGMLWTKGFLHWVPCDS